jgi:TPR repeat protein
MAATLCACAAKPALKSPANETSLQPLLGSQPLKTTAATKGVAPEFADGLLAHETGRYTDALKLFTPLAEQGFAPAQTMLGYLYAQGEGVAQDDARAIEWFRKAAEQGDADAQNNLGFMYANGRGTRANRGQAVKWYLEAAQQGHTEAQENLAALLSETKSAGWHSPPDGMGSLQQRANSGDNDAMYMVGESYLTGIGTHQDRTQGIAWLEKAASGGSAAARYRLGTLLATGTYIRKDESRGHALIAQSASQGYLKAQRWLEEQQPSTPPNDSVDEATAEVSGQ